MTSADNGSLLVVYALMQHPLRSTVSDHLHSFRRYSRARCLYVNAMVRDLPRWITGANHRAVIFHTSLLSALRWGDESTARVLLQRSRAAAPAGRVRVALPQDEFLNSEQLSRFIQECEVNLVCSVSPPSEWPKIYPQIDPRRVRFERVLTGYLDEATLRRITTIVDRSTNRLIDLGYRAGAERPYLGRHGLLKTDIARAGARAATAHGLSADISLRPNEVLVGDEWFRALASWRWTLGVEGGASILDRDGSLRARTERYTAEHPDAGFEEVEATCFPGQDGDLSLFALSPRHLEACATRTGQILVEGDYDGVLHPGRHYLALKRDLSNLDEVLEEARDEGRRAAVVEQAYRDVVESDRYTYRRFVEQVLGLVAELEPAVSTKGGSRSRAFHGAAAEALDRLSWLQVAYRLRGRQRVLKAFHRTIRIFVPTVALLRRWRDGVLGRSRG
jgi:hypothetical protein